MYIGKNTRTRKIAVAACGVMLVFFLLLSLTGCSGTQTATTAEEFQTYAEEEAATEAEEQAATEAEEFQTYAEEETTEPNACGPGGEDAHQILCFGDSNTYGYDPNTGGRYPEEVLWTTLLSEKLDGEYEVINEGLNGRTTAYDYPGMEGKNGLEAFQAYLQEHKTASVVIFMLGSNDFTIADLTAEDIAWGMEQLVLEIRELSAVACGWNPKIVVVTPPAVDADLIEQIYGYRPDAQAEISRQIVPLYEEIAEKYNCMFLDVSELLEVSDIDGVHLTEAGHETLAEQLFELLEPVLEK